MKAYEKLLRILVTVSGYLAALLMAALSMIVFLGVFSRYLLADPWQWTEEAARISFIWVVFLAASIAVRRGLHFRFTLLLDVLRPGWRRGLDVFANLWVIFFAGIMVVRGLSFALLNLAQLTPTLEIRWAWVYISVPLSGALMLLYSLDHIRLAATRAAESPDEQGLTQETTHA